MSDSLEKFEVLKEQALSHFRDKEYVRVVDGEVFVNARVLSTVQQALTEYALMLLLGGENTASDCVASSGLVAAAFNESVTTLANEIEPGVTARLKTEASV